MQKRINYPCSTLAFFPSRKVPRYSSMGVFHHVNASCNCCSDLGQWDNTFWLRVSSLSSPITSVPIKWIWFLASYTMSSCRRRRVICWSYLHKLMMAPGNVHASKQRCDWASLSLPALGVCVSVRGSPGVSVTQGSKARRENRWGEEVKRGELINSAAGERREEFVNIGGIFRQFSDKRQLHQREKETVWIECYWNTAFMMKHSLIHTQCSLLLTIRL